MIGSLVLRTWAIILLMTLKCMDIVKFSWMFNLVVVVSWMQKK